RELADGIVSRGAAVCGSPNIRNMATLVGNVAAALPSADTPPPLLALDARVVLRSRAATRRMALEDFFLGPATSARRPDELIESVEIPRPPPAPGAASTRWGAPPTTSPSSTAPPPCASSKAGSPSPAWWWEP
ncbi:Molybdopterin dehydrogenase, FAD-binding domain protein, partial [mine drainage metagenome]